LSRPVRRHWAELTSPEIAALPPDTVVILPTGATEQHGPHLPLAVDTLIATGILQAALTLLPPAVPALALPCLAIGHSPEHSAFPGTLTLGPETLRRVLTEMAEGVSRAGLRRLVLFNAHGGNPPILDLVAVDLRMRLGMAVVPLHWQQFGLPAGLFTADEVRFGIHGGAIETSLMMHLHPEQVRQDMLADFQSSAAETPPGRLAVQGSPGLAWAAQDLHPSGAVGNAATATAEKGRLLLEHAAQGLAGLIAELQALDPDRHLRSGPLT
jgi:creatinine amidohydrolase